MRGLAIKGTWWPDALDASLARVGTTDAQGQVEWTPSRAGPILLQGDQHDSLVRVRPPQANPFSWGILALLGLALVQRLVVSRLRAALELEVAGELASLPPELQGALVLAGLVLGVAAAWIAVARFLARIP